MCVGYELMANGFDFSYDAVAHKLPKRKHHKSHLANGLLRRNPN